MAGPILREGQRMPLPGVAFEIRSGDQPPDASAGVAGFVGRSNKGPLGIAVKCYGAAHLARVYGDLAAVGNTMLGAAETIQGGAEAVEVVRLGTGGAVATHTFVDGAAAQILRVDAKDVGTDGNNIGIAIRASVVAPAQDLVVYYLGLQKEVFTYTPGTDAALAAATKVAAQGSDYITATKLLIGNGALAVVAATLLTAGTNPTITNGDYGTAIDLLLRRPIRAFAVDSEVTAVHAIVKAAVDNGWDAGRRRIAVVGEPTSVTWSTRVTNGASFNDPAMVYVATGHARPDDLGVLQVIQGYRAAGLEAGRHSVLPLGRQMTNRPVRRATQLVETIGGVLMIGAGLDDDQLEEAIANGMYVYGLSDAGQVITVEGNTTYHNFAVPPEWATTADAGWGKSRLVITRAMLFDDIYAAWAPMIPDLTNNDAGRESLLREAKNVIELKYQPKNAIGDYSLTVASDPPPAGDEATFLLACSTPDGLERMRLIATFRR